MAGPEQPARSSLSGVAYPTKTISARGLGIFGKITRGFHPPFPFETCSLVEAVCIEENLTYNSAHRTRKATRSIFILNYTFRFRHCLVISRRALNINQPNHILLAKSCIVRPLTNRTRVQTLSGRTNQSTPQSTHRAVAMHVRAPLLK